MIKDWYTQHNGDWHQIEDVQDTGIPAHKPGGGNKVKLKGKDKWVHASEVKGLEPKPPKSMTKSEAISKLMELAKSKKKALSKKEAINKLKDLAKGVAQRKWPVTAPSQSEEKATQDWVFSSSSNSDGKGFDRSLRDKTPKMDDNRLSRGIHKLHGKTESRRSASGEREFLLHRGVSEKELNSTVKDGMVSHDSMSSWTPNVNTAEAFSIRYGSGGRLKPRKQHYVSAWIPESRIHSIPKEHGEQKGSIRGEHMLANEHEVILKPGTGTDAKVTQYSTKAGKKMTKSEAISKLKELIKGSAQRRMPFNPVKDVEDQDAHNILRWSEDESYEEKLKIPRMEGNVRDRSIRKLHARTKSRRNPDTNEAEFLLHRGLTDSDHSNGLGKYPSFSLHPGIAADFADEDEHSNVNMISSWVPESKIHHIPDSIGRFGKQAEHSHEGEVIVDNSEGHIDHKSGKNAEITPIGEVGKKFSTRDPSNIHSRINYKKLMPEGGRMKKSEAIAKLRSLKKPI